MNRRAAAAAGLATCLALAACATPETRLRTGLVNAGLSKPVAACMADRMVDRLSLGQLLKISKLERIKTGRKDGESWQRFLRNIRALQDPEILGVATSSGAICAIRAG